jgi:RNA polymerase sigma-70 factor (ECF subfamily)
MVETILSLAGGTFCAVCQALFLLFAAVWGMPPAGLRKENGRMRIEYEFVTGEVSEIEVEDSIGEVLLDFDRQERNNDRRETRRHMSLDGMDFEGEWFVSAEDTEGDVLYRDDMERLAGALGALSPEQRRLVLKVYFKEMRLADIAHDEGVSEAAVRNRLKKIYRKLKKILD